MVCTECSLVRFIHIINLCNTLSHRAMFMHDIACIHTHYTLLVHTLVASMHSQIHEPQTSQPNHIRDSQVHVHTLYDSLETLLASRPTLTAVPMAEKTQRVSLEEEGGGKEEIRERRKKMGKREGEREGEARRGGGAALKSERERKREEGEKEGREGFRGSRKMGKREGEGVRQIEEGEGVGERVHVYI